MEKLWKNPKLEEPKWTLRAFKNFLDPIYGAQGPSRVREMIFSNLGLE